MENGKIRKEVADAIIEPGVCVCDFNLCMLNNFGHLHTLYFCLQGNGTEFFYQRRRVGTVERDGCIGY